MNRKDLDIKEEPIVKYNDHKLTESHIVDSIQTNGETMESWGLELERCQKYLTIIS